MALSVTAKYLLLLLSLVICQQIHSYTIHKEPKDDLYKRLDSMEESNHYGYTHQSIGNKKKCYPLTIPICKRLGYNATSARRDLYGNDRTKDHDIAKYLEFFENEICFEDLIFFVCTLFNPVCFKNQQQDILPCRSECRNVKKQCKGTIEKFQLKWPAQLKCNNLPDYQTDVCLTRKSIVTPKQLARQNEADLLKQKAASKCPVCKRSSNAPHNYRQFKKADYGIEGQFLSKTKTASGNLKLTFLVKKVFKQGIVPITKYGMISIWTTGLCLCPNLSYDKKYIIVGTEDGNHEQLLFDKNTFVVRKTRFWKRLMLQWKRKYRLDYAHRLHNLKAMLTNHQ